MQPHTDLSWIVFVFPLNRGVRLQYGMTYYGNTLIIAGGITADTSAMLDGMDERKKTTDGKGDTTTDTTRSQLLIQRSVCVCMCAFLACVCVCVPPSRCVAFL